MVKKTKKQNGGSNVPKGAKGNAGGEPTKRRGSFGSFGSFKKSGSKKKITRSSFSETPINKPNGVIKVNSFGVSNKAGNQSKKVPEDVGYMYAKPPTESGYMSVENMKIKPEDAGYMTADEIHAKVRTPTDSGYIYTIATNKKHTGYMSVTNMKKQAQDKGYMTTSEINQGANYMTAEEQNPNSRYMTVDTMAKKAKDLGYMSVENMTHKAKYKDYMYVDTMAQKPTEAVYINVAAANPPKTSHYVNISPYPNTTKKAYDFLTQKAKQGAVFSTRLARINPEYLSTLDKDTRLPYLENIYGKENAPIIDNMLKNEIDNLKTNTDKANRLSIILTDFKNRALENNKKRTNIVENITLFTNKRKTINPNVRQKVRTTKRSMNILKNAKAKGTPNTESIYSTLGHNRIGINPFIPSSTR